MEPCIERIQKRAYALWEHAGRPHGHDRNDWLIAERLERFESNYRLISCELLDLAQPRVLGPSSPRHCRFCDQGEGETEFSTPVKIVPTAIGVRGPLALDQCDACATGFATGIDRALVAFVDAGDATRDRIPVDAYKGLVKIALSILPRRDLDEHESAIEWVSNPDHQFDFNVFRDLVCVQHNLAQAYPKPWLALARKTSEDEAWPSRLLFLGTNHRLYQVSIPMGHSDEDQDVAAGALPDILPPVPFGRGYEPTLKLSLRLTPAVSQQPGEFHHA